MYHVYILVDPSEPSHVRYVGITKDPSKRLQRHINSAKSYPNGTKKENWIGSLLVKGARPELVVLDSTSSEDEVFSLEVDLIKAFTEDGHTLTNGTSGGRGFDPYWENKTGRTLEDLWSDEDWIQGKVNTFKEYWAKDENRKAQSERVSRHFEDPENRKAISEGLKRYFNENPAQKWTDEQKLAFKSSEGYQKMVADKQTSEHKELMRSRAQEQYSNPEARKESSEHAKRGWANLTPEQREIRVLKGRLGTNLSWARKHGRVLELSPKNCNCKESK